MSEELNAKAEAKAAKARAKALRPWYKKKRFWVLGAIGLLVIGSVASQEGSDPSPSSSGQSSGNETSTEDTIGTGLGSKDASGDIDNLSCGTPDSLGARYPEVKVTNRSEKTSTYFITVVFESSDGGTKYDDTMIVISSLKPGQTMTETGLIFNDIPDGAICKITEIQRTAS